MPFLTLLFGVLLAPVITGLLASVLCCLSILRDKEPPWSCGVLSAMLGMFSSLWLIFGGDVFRPARWPSRIPGQWDSFVIALSPSIFFTIAVVLIAEALFREHYNEHLSREQKHLLRRQRRQRSWQRARWFNLFGSSMLIVGLTGSLVWSHSAGVSSDDTAVVSDYSAALNWNPHTLRAPESQGRAARATPAPDLAPVAIILWPFCVLGLMVSGGWFAYTVTYWRGYMRIKPRNPHDLLTRHHPPATGH